MPISFYMIFIGIFILILAACLDDIIEKQEEKRRTKNGVATITEVNKEAGNNSTFYHITYEFRNGYGDIATGKDIIVEVEDDNIGIFMQKGYKIPIIYNEKNPKNSTPHNMYFKI